MITRTQDFRQSQISFLETYVEQLAAKTEDPGLDSSGSPKAPTPWPKPVTGTGTLAAYSLPAT